MARNLEEPGANFNQLLELSLKLQNARTFAGTKVADASTEMEQYPDTYLRPGETLEDWDGHYFRKPNAAGGRIGLNSGGSLEKLLRNYWQGMGPWGKGSTGAFYFSDLYDALAPYLGMMFSEGGRVGFDQGGMSRRTFLKLLGGLGSMPLLGKYVKWAKPLAKKLDDIKISIRGDADGWIEDDAWTGNMWSNVSFQPLTKKGTEILKKLAKQKNSFLKEVKSKYGNYFEPDTAEDASVIVNKIKPNAKMQIETAVGNKVKGSVKGAYENTKVYSGKNINKNTILDEADGMLADDMGGYSKRQFNDEFVEDIIDQLSTKVTKAEGGRIYGKYAQQLASGGRAGYQEGNTVLPKVKPFTADMFKDKADLYLQGIFAGPNKDLFLPKIRSVLQKAVNEGSITQEEGMKFISDRILFYKNFAEENPKGTLPRWEKNKGGRIGLAEGDTPSQAWMRDYFYSSGLDDKGIITLYEFINGPLGWKAYMEHGPGKS